MDCSILIVGYNNNYLIEQCLNHFYDDIVNSNVKFEIIVVENGEEIITEPSYSYSRKNVKWLKSASNLGYGRANNWGFNVSCGEVIIVMNPDVIITGEALISLYKSVLQEENTIYSCKLKFPDDTIQNNSFPKIRHLRDAINRNIILEKFNIQLNAVCSQEIIGFSGALFAMNRNDIQDNQLFQPFYFMYDEEVDFFYRWNKSGGKVKFLNNIVAYHMTEGTISNKIWMVRQKKVSHMQFIRNFYGLSYYLFFFIIQICNSFTSIILFPFLSKDVKCKIRQHWDFSNWKYYFKLIFFPQDIYMIKYEKP